MSKSNTKNIDKSRLNFFNQIFKKKGYRNYVTRFGKYSDRNKTAEQIDAFRKAEEFFDNKEYLKAVEQFFLFVKNDDEKNFDFIKRGNNINFSYYQGSKKVLGKVDDRELFAYSEIIKIKKEDYQLYKTLLEINYDLKFNKFIIENNIVKIVLNLTMDELNADLLYFALREIAIAADRYDDLLAMKFPEVIPTNNTHIIELRENEFKTKTKYLKDWLDDTLKRVDKLDAVKFAGARNFILMNFVYKTLYLIVPQGELLEKLTVIIDYFHNEKNKTLAEKANFILYKLRDIGDRDEDYFKKSLYNVTFTFPVNLPANPSFSISFAKNEIQKIYWYESNAYDDIAQDILEYIMGYVSFHFGNIPIIDELILIFFEVLEKEYMGELGIRDLPYEKDIISYFSLNKKISLINSVAKKHYPEFFFNVKHLNLQNRYEFAKSFINEFVNQNFSN